MKPDNDTGGGYVEKEEAELWKQTQDKTKQVTEEEEVKGDFDKDLLAQAAS